MMGPWTVMNYGTTPVRTSVKRRRCVGKSVERYYVNQPPPRAAI